MIIEEMCKIKAKRYIERSRKIFADAKAPF